VTVRAAQSNHEGELIDVVQKARADADVLIINGRRVHAHQRRAARRRSPPAKSPRLRSTCRTWRGASRSGTNSFLTAVCVGQISGFGAGATGWRFRRRSTFSNRKDAYRDEQPQGVEGEGGDQTGHQTGCRRFVQPVQAIRPEAASTSTWFESWRASPASSNLSEVEADPSGHVRVRRRFAAKMTERKGSSPAVPALSLAPPPPSEGTAEPGMMITSPFVGTFYRAPSPDTAAFVEMGDTVRKGQVVCIVEAMKLMNEIEAEADGRVAEILVQNGAHVEYGQAMIRLGQGLTAPPANDPVRDVQEKYS